MTVRLAPAVKRAIAVVPDDSWETIRYTDAIFEENTGVLISSAEVAETSFTAFSSRKESKQVPGRLAVRRIPKLNAQVTAGQRTLFDQYRFHVFFTTVDPAAWILLLPTRRTVSMRSSNRSTRF